MLFRFIAVLTFACTGLPAIAEETGPPDTYCLILEAPTSEESFRKVCALGQVMYWQTTDDYAAGYLAAVFCDMTLPVVIDRFTPINEPASVSLTCTAGHFRTRDGQ